MQRKYITNCIETVSLVIIFILCIIFGYDSIAKDNHNIHKYPDTSHEQTYSTIESMYLETRKDLIHSIDSTIRVYAPSTHINGEEILNQCELFEVDLFFVLAQAHIESHFGTRGMALKTNSVFNVFAYDDCDYIDIDLKGKYNHPNDSVVPYLKLLKNRYLVNGKTEKDLMNNYVDKDGRRYASSKEYEINLSKRYRKYISNKPLMNSFRRYSEYRNIIKEHIL